MDANKTAGEEARRQLHKNAACNLEQVLAATSHKTQTVRPPASFTKTIQVRRTRHAGHCWRSRDQLIRDVLLWTPTHGRAKPGRPARTYIQQLCEDTGCCPEDLPRAMNDREECRERVRDIRATSTTWWWWWWWWWLFLMLISSPLHSLCYISLSFIDSYFFYFRLSHDLKQFLLYPVDFLFLNILLPSHIIFH